MTYQSPEQVELKLDDGTSAQSDHLRRFSSWEIAWM